MRDPDNPADKYRDLWLTGPPPSVEQYVAGLGALSAVSLADVLRADQIERWERGSAFPAEWYLNTFPAISDDAEGCLLLIYGEVLSRTARGDDPTLAEYTARFPQFTELLALQWEVHHAFEAAAVTDTIDPALPRFAAEDLPPCVVVPGYDVEGEVGRGAVAVVYRARQMPLNRLVALKVVMEGQLARPEKLVRFLDEARVIARLKHPNIVAIYDLGKHDVGPFMALEWVDGGTLAERLKRGPLEPADAARLLATVARAVGHAHQQGVVHRDLKPANILLTLAGDPKVADFGLAKHLDLGSGATATGLPVGTPQYMAPEQTRGSRTVSPASDVYALGVTLFECITGRAPLVGATIPDTLRLVSDQEPPNPRTLNSKVPRDLSTICLKCLEKEPLRRYKSGHELADDLEAFAAGLPVTARPIGPAERLWRWSRRHRQQAAMIFTVIGTLSIATVGALVAAVFFQLERDRAELAERETRDRVAGLEQARLDAKDKLWRSLVSEARGVRRSGRPGQRTAALVKLAEARALVQELGPAGRPASAEDLGLIRDEIAACLVLPDVTPAATVGPFDAGWTPVAVAADGTAVAIERVTGDVAVRRVPGGDTVATLPPAGPPVPLPVVFSPDGRFLARTSAAKSGRVRHQIWEVAGPVLRYDAEATAVAARPVFAPNTATVAVPTPDALVQVRTATGAVAAVTPGNPDGGAAYDPADRWLAAIVDGEFRRISTVTGAVTHRWPAPGGRVLAWSPSGAAVAIGIGREVHVLDPLAGTPIRDALPAFGEPGGSFAFEPSGRYAVAADPAGLVRVWDVAAGRELFSAPARVSAVCVGPGGVIGFEAVDRKAVVLRLDLPTAYRTFAAAFPKRDGEYLPDPRVAVSPVGGWLAVPSTGGVRLLDAALGTDFGPLPEDIGTRVPVRFTAGPSGLGLITAGTGGLARWPLFGAAAVTVGPPERLHPVETREAVDATPDGNLVAVPEPGRHALLFRPALPGGTVRTDAHAGLRGCAVSPDGRWVLTGGGDWDRVVLWDAETGKQLRELAPEGGTGVFGPDGARLAVRRAGGGGRVWKLIDGVWQPGPALPGGAFAFAPDGRLLAVQVGYGEVHLLDADTGRTVARLEAPHLTRLVPAGFSPDGATFVAAGQDSRAVHVWNLRDLREHLAARGADWDWPTLPPAAVGPAQSKRVQVTLGTEARRKGVEAYRAFQRFEYRKATELCRQVLAADPTDPMTRHVLAMSKIRGGNTLYDVPGAAAILDGLTAEFPQHPSYRLSRGVVRFHQGRLREAAADLERAVAEIRGGPGPYFWGYLAAARALVGDVTGARAALKPMLSGVLIGDADWRRWLPAGK